MRIVDYGEEEHGNRTAVLNKKETAIAQGKQELINQAFADWIWTMTRLAVEQPKVSWTG